MVIDCHTHIGFNSVINASPKQLVASMKRAGINKALVFAGELNNCPTEKLLAELKDYQNVLYPIGSISPLSNKKPSLKKVEAWLKENQIYGLKFYPGYEQFYPYDKALRPYLKLLIKYNRPVIFHSGDTYNLFAGAKLKYAHPLNIDDLAVEMPNLKIVIAHMGNPWVIDLAEVILKNKNIYTDCSGLVYDNFKPSDVLLFKRLRDDFKMFSLSFGAKDRLMFGTDWPIADQSDYVKNTRLVLGNNKKIFSETARKIFRI